MPTINDRFKMRRGSAADLAAVNEVPLKGEWIWEEDQGLDDGKYKLKIGDGVTHYNDLEYLASGGGIEDVTPGSHIVIDKSNPANPVIGVSGLTVSSSYAEGTSFPTSPTPAVDDKFYRTDLNLLCYYDGAQWLTVQEYQVDFTPAAVVPWSGVLGAIAGVDPDFGMYITRWLANTYVSSPNSPSSYWSLGLYYRTPADATILWKSQSTAADSPGRAVPHVVLVNSLLPSGTVLLQFGAVKTGGPGAFFPHPTLLYRRVVA